MAARKTRRKAVPKKPVGRPTKYRVSYPEQLISFFAEKLSNVEGKPLTVLKEAAIDLPTLGAFARSINVTSRTITNWAKSHDEFAEAVEMANGIQEEMLEALSLKGVWTPSQAMFSLKYRHGWIDKLTVDQNTSVTLHFDEQDKEA